MYTRGSIQTAYSRKDERKEERKSTTSRRDERRKKAFDVYVNVCACVCVFFVCVRVCAHIVAIGRRSLVESVPTSLSRRVKWGRGGREEESVNRSRNDAAGNAKHEMDTPTHHRAGIRTRAEVKDDTVSDSFPAGDEREKKRRGSGAGEAETEG